MCDLKMGHRKVGPVVDGGLIGNTSLGQISHLLQDVAKIEPDVWVFGYESKRSAIGDRRFDQLILG